MGCQAQHIQTVGARMRHVDLCSGIGGFALGFQMAGLSNPILFCEIDKWCQKILRQHWRDVPILEDVKELANDPERTVPDCDILTAGYPCQPFSTAGLRKGAEDDRHIWPYIMQIVACKRPTWCVFENVAGHISLGLDEVLSDLEAEGYSARPFVIGACGVDAPHRRLRVWIVAHSNRSSDRRTSRQYEETNGEVSKRHDSGVAYQSSEVCSGETPRKANFWSTEPNVGRVANGVPKRVDRIKGLGNAIVPQIAEQIGRVIKEINDAS